MKNKLIIEPNKTKKVGLLTYHHTTNFGSLLQTFALYKTITEIGYPCEIIDYRNEAVEQREFIKKLYQCRSLREIKHHLQYSKEERKQKNLHCFYVINLMFHQRFIIRITFQKQIQDTIVL